MDEHSKVMSMMIKNYSKPHNPPYRPYMTGPRLGREKIYGFSGIGEDHTQSLSGDCRGLYMPILWQRL